MSNTTLAIYALAFVFTSAAPSPGISTAPPTGPPRYAAQTSGARKTRRPAASLSVGRSWTLESPAAAAPGSKPVPAVSPADIPDHAAVLTPPAAASRVTWMKLAYRRSPRDNGHDIASAWPSGTVRPVGPTVWRIIAPTNLKLMLATGSGRSISFQCCPGTVRAQEYLTKHTVVLLLRIERSLGSLARLPDDSGWDM